MIFEGVSTAIITPFDDKGNVNYTKFKELINIQINSGIKCITICGTTGEASTLSEEERKSIISFAISYVDKKIKIIVGTGSNDTKKAIQYSKEVERLGADGCLIVTPYYNKCNQEGLYLHYKQIAESINIPIILYNVPSRTSVNIDPETVIKLSKIDNIVGLKQANSDISQSIEIINNVDSSFYIYSGNDDLFLPILAIGGKGVISVFSNILPKEFINLYNYYINVNIDEARKIQLKYIDLIKLLFKDVNPIPIKLCMNILGLDVGSPRLPLYISDNNLKEEFKVCLKYHNMKGY